jgi:urease alpha subunit
MPKSGKPEKVRRAMLGADRAALRRMGAAGARKSQETKEMKRALRELAEIEQKEDFRKRDEEANFHICPLDD